MLPLEGLRGLILHDAAESGLDEGLYRGPLVDRSPRDRGALTRGPWRKWCLSLQETLGGSDEAVFALLGGGFPLKKATFFFADSFIDHDDGSIMAKHQKTSGNFLTNASAI